MREGEGQRQTWGRVVSDLNLVPLRGNQVHPSPRTWFRCAATRFIHRREPGSVARQPGSFIAANLVPLRGNQVHPSPRTWLSFPETLLTG
jgi:hypothetical protein